MYPSACVVAQCQIDAVCRRSKPQSARLYRHDPNRRVLSSSHYGYVPSIDVARCYGEVSREGGGGGGDRRETNAIKRAKIIQQSDHDHLCKFYTIMSEASGLMAHFCNLIRLLFISGNSDGENLIIEVTNKVTSIIYRSKRSNNCIIPTEIIRKADQL